MFSSYIYKILFFIIVISLAYIAMVKVSILDSPYTCEVCEEDYDEIYTCKKCGRYFCNQCGDTKNNLCKRCIK